MSLLKEYDPERPMLWEPGGWSPTVQAAEKVRTGLVRLPAHARCRYCHGYLSRKSMGGGLTPQGEALGWFLRGEGPWCLEHYHYAWQCWKRGLYFGKTELHGW